MNRFIEKFSLGQEKEVLQTVVTNVENGVVFRGTNLWVLIFAVFVASLGLNVNSTAVIIGAMLISPLMGPIIGMGLSMGISDAPLLRKAFYNYAVATGVALTTSTIFFLISPINDAHSEILARTQPNIYDVLIALFGGLAGMMAISSTQKGNVIPGVAIATALMPPLCTAGYGIATLQWKFFTGAFYLYIINTVFIALASLLVVRLMGLPFRKIADRKGAVIARRLIWVVVLITLVPSLYLGYDLIRQDRFMKQANAFITNEAHFRNDYLLNKKIDPKARQITLVFGGEEIDSLQIDNVKSKLSAYNLADAKLEIKQGFTNLSTANKSESEQQLTRALEKQDILNRSLQRLSDSLKNQDLLSIQLFNEIKVQYPTVQSAIIHPVKWAGDSSLVKPIQLFVIESKPALSQADRTKLEAWIGIRLPNKPFRLLFN